MKITPNELISSFGTLITGMLGGVNMTTESLNALLNKEINITEDVARTLQVHISGGIDMFNNDGTNLLVELTGADKYNDVRASIGYSPACSARASSMWTASTSTRCSADSSTTSS